MIKVNMNGENTHMEINGIGPDILTELTMLIRELDDKIGKKYVDKSIELARKSKAELNREAEEVINRRYGEGNMFGKLIKAVILGGDSEDSDKED